MLWINHLNFYHHISVSAGLCVCVCVNMLIKAPFMYRPGAGKSRLVASAAADVWWRTRWFLQTPHCRRTLWTVNWSGWSSTSIIVPLRSRLFCSSRVSAHERLMFKYWNPSGGNSRSTFSSSSCFLSSELLTSAMEKQLETLCVPALNIQTCWWKFCKV